MKLRGKILFIALVPILVLGTVLCIISSIKISNALKNEVKEELITQVLSETNSISSIDGNHYYLGEDDCLYNGADWNLTEDTAAIDKIKDETGVVTTVFFGDTRYLTSVKKDDGSRALRTKASEQVIDTVIKKGQSFFAENVDVVGKPYFAYYAPLYNDGETEPCGMVFAGKPQVVVDNMVRSVVLVSVIITVVIVAISVVLVVIVAQSISNKMKQSIGALDKVAEGQLNVNINRTLLNGSDETAEIVKSVTNLKQQLTTIVSDITSKSRNVNEFATNLSKSNEKIADALEQIERAINEIAVGATAQATDTSAATEGVLNMGNLVQQTDNNVDTLFNASNQMEESGKIAYDALKELETVNAKAKDSIDIIYKQTNTTNESAGKIAEAITLITSIAEETNLLSLNASIEAARAGEQGRGFAVVASQIQKLAEQSNDSAKRIDEITRLLMEDSQKAVETMENVKDIMNTQSEMVDKTAGSFNDVMDGIEKSRTCIKYISKDMAQLNESRKSVIDVVSNLSAIAEENAASTEETSASTTEVNSIVQSMTADVDELLSLSNELQDSVKIFTV